LEHRARVVNSTKLRVERQVGVAGVEIDLRVATVSADALTLTLA